MKNAIHSVIRGIKCDAPGCDYHNDEPTLDDYPAWLNRPCPKCGANLLTQADLDATHRLIAATNLLNAIMAPAVRDLPEPADGAVLPVISADMNGSGKVTFTLNIPPTDDDTSR